MPLPDIFSQKETDIIIERINKLTPETKAGWGKMTVGQMLAHCNVTYEMVYDDKHTRPNFFIKFILRILVKNKVVNDLAYKKNSQTAPQFIIKDERDFSKEQVRLIEYLRKTQALGADYFNHKDAHSFGPLNKSEWNNMFYKHLDHHLTQFGV